MNNLAPETSIVPILMIHNLYNMEKLIFKRAGEDNPIKIDDSVSGDTVVVFNWDNNSIQQKYTLINKTDHSFELGSFVESPYPATRGGKRRTHKRRDQKRRARK